MTAFANADSHVLLGLFVHDLTTFNDQLATGDLFEKLASARNSAVQASSDGVRRTTWDMAHTAFPRVVACVIFPDPKIDLDSRSEFFGFRDYGDDGYDDFKWERDTRDHSSTHSFFHLSERWTNIEEVRMWKALGYDITSPESSL